jgi:vacuolar-type H+-ATPase subunit I/STV1
MFERFSRRVDIAIRSAACSGVGALLLIVGLGFFTVAAWFALATALPPAEVALIIGAGYFGLGLILFAVAAFIRAPVRRARRSAAETPAVASSAAAMAGAGMAQAFLMGLDAGRAAAARRRH